MSSQNNKSELAFLMAQFEAERQAAEWALTGLASNVSKHEFITARMERMGQIQGQLAPLIGDDEAGRMVVEAMEKIDNPPE
jgi:hypothetical protein